MNEKLDLQDQSGVNLSEIKTGRQTGVISRINLELISVRLKLEDEQVGLGVNKSPILVMGIFVIWIDRVLISLRLLTVRLAGTSREYYFIIYG